MQDDFSQDDLPREAAMMAMAGSSRYQSDRGSGLGKWVILALILALGIHAALIWGLRSVSIAVNTSSEDEPEPTQIVRLRRIALDDAPPEVFQQEPVADVEPDAMEVEPPEDEIDLLKSITGVDIDIRPDVAMMEVPMVDSLLRGDLDSEDFEPLKANEYDPELPKMGVTDDLFTQADAGAVIVDPGSRMAEAFDPDEYTDSLRKGEGGAAADALFKQFSSLDEMSHMDGNSLQATKALISSDLLFDFNSSTLRASARVSLMKVALLINQHPELTCWVDGHSDLIGGEEPNLILSQKRAMAVKSWLTQTLELGSDRIAVSGYGETQPLILSGSADEQAANRRVEIKMRRGRPEGEVNDLKPTEFKKVGDPQSGQPASANSSPRASSAADAEPVLVKPVRSIPLPENQRPENLPPVNEPVGDLQPHFDDLPEVSGDHRIKLDEAGAVIDQARDEISDDIDLPVAIPTAE